MLVSGAFIILYLVVIWKAGLTYLILYLFALTCFLQYILSSYPVYEYYQRLNFRMVVSEEQYFGCVIPALVFLFGGLFFSNRDFRADNDFYIFFNCFIKGFLIFWAVNYIRRRWQGPTKYHRESKLVYT